MKSDIDGVIKPIPQAALFISAEDELAWDTTPEFEALRQKYIDKLAQPMRRKKIWELKAELLCQLVGTCFSTDELLKLARGARLHGREGMSEFALHHAAVTEAAHRNPFSERMQKLLEKKYELVIKRFNKAKTDADLVVLWHAERMNGDIGAGMWAAVTHTYVSAQFARSIYEDMHMLSHQVGVGVRGDQKLMAQLSEEVIKLRARLQRNSERFAQDMADKEQIIRIMQQRVTELLATAANLKQVERRVLELESNSERQSLLARVAWLERQLQVSERHKQRDEDVATIIPITPVVAAMPMNECGVCEEKQTGRCGGSDLAGRSVLCVGGRAALYPEYRRVVEESGGQFLIHDGGREDSIHRLPTLLARADVVVCPADCLSHGAYYAVKRYCKRFGKPCALLDRSGVSTFRKGVEAVAEAAAGTGIVSFSG